jgi:hypothetical protein
MEILGLLDTLESMILEGLRVPLTKKTLINEEKVLQVLDKIRLVAQGGGDLARTAIGKKPGVAAQPKQETIEFVSATREIEKVKQELAPMSEGDLKATEIIENAYKIAKEVRMGADKYADEVLSNLEATSSRILRAVKAGRSRLGKFVIGTTLRETRPEEK